MISGFKDLRDLYRRVINAIRIAVNRFSLRCGWFDMPCQAMGAGRTARSDRRSGVVRSQEASWIKELDGKELRGALGGKRNLETRGSSFSGHRLPILLRELHCGMLVLNCTLVLVYITILFLYRELCYSRTFVFNLRLVTKA